MDLHTHLRVLDGQQSEMANLLTAWSSINSGSRHLDGLARMAAAVEAQFASLGGPMRWIELPPERSIDSSGQVVAYPLGRLLSITKRPDAPIRVLLNIHYDTVFGADHPFQQPRLSDADTLVGPGVVDAKGGLVVMLYALRALEQSPLAERIGWEVIVNPDEEIGSPGSAAILREAAARSHLGLLFEPALPDGSLVGTRKGSGNFTIVVRGRAAHAGRDFAHGRSALLALAELVLKIDRAQDGLDGVTINCGRVEGGGATNIVPDLAIGRFNARVATVEQQHEVERRFAAAVIDVSRRDGITIEQHGGFHAPPKLLDPRTAALMDQILSAAGELGLNLSHQTSGGASDGNKLAAAGLAVVDTMGPVGGHLHSDREYVKLSSLVERARLTTLVLLKLAAGEFSVADLPARPIE